MNSETRQHPSPESKKAAGLRGLFRSGLFAALTIGAGAALLAGCLERPVCDNCRPGTSNVIVRKVPINNIAAIDLLFLIDNSASMADKQAVMKQAVPAMLNRLITPNCVVKNAQGDIVDSVAGMRMDGEVNCPGNMSLEFQPVNDIHIAVVTSSLGSHGYDGQLTCDDPATPEKNDRARPISLVRGALSGQPEFLTWTGKENAADLGTAFGNFVGAAGETGCGLEATHESWYRFLVDPEPPVSMSIVDGEAQRGPVDTELLDMRKRFLRPNSLVAVVVLTDENDCSAMDGGSYYDFAEYGYLTNDITQPAIEATDVCEENPNDKCCQSCRLRTPAAGCEAQFAKCATKPALPKEEDQNNVRCFQNQRRFGFDLLYPVTRYIDGLSQSQVRGANGELLTNPLVNGREPGLIFFAGITGVPWQDLATPETLRSADTLKYLTARELTGPVDIDGTKQAYTYWDLILGVPGKHVASNYCKERSNGDGTFKDPDCGLKPVLPRDPFMVESIEPRTGRADVMFKTNDRAGVSITDSPAWNNVNGHEYRTDQLDKAPNGDLQYACTFPLAPFNGVKTQAECDANPSSCDCSSGNELADKPLCKQQAGGSAGGGQFWGKAYPSTRTLEILKGFGENSIVASICPKVTDSSKQDYGYNPAVSAIVDRLAEKLGGQCLPRALTANEETGEVPCVVVESRAKLSEAVPDLDCSMSGRIPATDKIRKAVIDELEKAGQCFFESTPAAERRGNNSCEVIQMCSIKQLDKMSAEGQYCRTNPGADSGSPGEAGYCYIDEKQEGAGALLDECPVNEKRKLRFVHPQSAPTPQNNTNLFYACVGEAATGR